MEIKIENLAMILKANMILDGITVIASKNDSGKSTIGKAIFSIIYTINNFKKEYRKSIEKYIDISLMKARMIFSSLEKKEELKNIEQVKKEFLEYVDKILVKEKNNEFFEPVYTKVLLENIKNIYEKDKELSNHINKNSVIDEIDRMVEILKKTSEYFTIVNKSFEKALKIEFETGISNLFLEDKHTTLQLDNLKINLENDKVISVDFLTQDLIDKYNVIYIESPLILDYINNICDNLGVYSGEENKVRNLKNNLTNVEQFNIVDTILGKEEKLEEIIKKIENIILGEFSFDKQSENYKYKKNGVNIGIKNTANGIKSFGIIEILLKNKKLNENTILIIDEPEVHLHPTWQIKYAEILSLLVKELGVKVLLNSHSPYFIQAIDVFSKKYKVDKKFYSLIDSEDKKAKILVDKTENLSYIYNELVEAYDILDEINNEILGEI